MSTTTNDTFADRARAALVGYLAERGVAVADGPAGEVLVPFVREGRSLLIAGRIGERPAEGLFLQLLAGEAVPREHWGATLMAINNWNARVPCPRAVLRVDDWEHDTHGTLTLDVWLPFGPGGAVDDGQVAEIAATVLAATSFFAGHGTDDAEDRAR
jgi:hypothetical protein